MKRVLLFSLTSLVVLLLAACSSGPKPQEVTIEMSEFAFTPDTLELQVGQEVTIHLINKGALDHEFMLGRDVMMMDGNPGGFNQNLFTEDPMVMGGEDDHGDSGMAMGGMDHGFMVSVGAGTPEQTIQFTVTEDMVGEWEMACFLDGGVHYNSGMHGTVVVKP